MSALDIAATGMLAQQFNVEVTSNNLANMNTTVINGNQIEWSGSLRYAASVAIVSGTTLILLNGTGTWDSPSGAAAGAIRNNVTINTAGTITWSGNIHLGAHREQRDEPGIDRAVNSLPTQLTNCTTHLPGARGFAGEL